MHVVAVLALDTVMPFELAIPHRILGSATGDDGRRLYEVLTCSIDGRPVRTSADFAVAVDHGPEIVRDAPHNAAIGKVDAAACEDPARWATTWRALQRKQGGAAA